MLNPSFHDEPVGDWHLLQVQGEIDMATAPLLRQQIMTLVTRGSIQIVLDLEGVDFIDSTGLGVLVGAVKRVRTAAGELRVVSTRPNLLDLFEITRLTNVFAVFASVEAATSAPIGPAVKNPAVKDPAFQDQAEKDPAEKDPAFQDRAVNAPEAGNSA